MAPQTPPVRLGDGVRRVRRPSGVALEVEEVPQGQAGDIGILQSDVHIPINHLPSSSLHTSSPWGRASKIEAALASVR